MRRLKEDDRGIAGAIGVLLILAVMVTAWANAMRTQIPLYGADAEDAWDREVSRTLSEFSRALGAGLTAGAPMAMIIPPPAEPRALDVPLLGRAEPHSASGMIAFLPACASFTGSHRLTNAVTIDDLREGATGCLTFQAMPIYGPGFGYRVELGGILRVQDDRAVVLAGPPLEMDASIPTEARIAIGLPGLRGAASSASVGGTSARVDLIPGPYAGEVEQTPNAASADWRFETAYPQAWKVWFETRLAQAGFVASRVSPGVGQSASDFTLACDPVDCSRAASGMGALVVHLEGPRTDGDDLKLSVTYGIFDVNIR